MYIYILTKRNIEKERERESERERERKRERENKNQKHKIVRAPFQQLRIFNVYIYITYIKQTYAISKGK